MSEQKMEEERAQGNIEKTLGTEQLNSPILFYFHNYFGTEIFIVNMIYCHHVLVNCSLRIVMRYTGLN